MTDSPTKKKTAPPEQEKPKQPAQQKVRQPSKKRKQKGKKTKPKRSLLDHIINIVCIIILIIMGLREYKHLGTPEIPPMMEYTSLYEKHYQPTLYPPFVIPYYLLIPENYDPERYIYPVVVALHGAGSHYTYAGYYLASPEFRKQFPAFVIVPWSSTRSVWAEPDDKRYHLQRRGLKFPDSMPQVMSIVNTVISKYSINTNKIYITGHSMGGMGTYGALKRYPDTFAGAIVVSGMWNPEEARMIDNAPLWIFHGKEDRQILPTTSKEIAHRLRKTGRENVKYTEFPGEGHGIWPYVYSSPSLWEWLFQQKL